MNKILGLWNRTYAKVFYYMDNDEDIKKGDYVVIDSTKGQEIVRVVSINDGFDESLNTILRIATEKDMEAVEANSSIEKEAFQVCKIGIKKRDLPMHLLDVEYTLDKAKMIFYFLAENRVDFRDLVKDLANVYRVRIELRQVGTREATRLLGGLGVCGRPLCCHCYSMKLGQPTIKTVKNQGICISPTKISGVCGKIMCCMNYEEDTYLELNKNMPKIGDIVKTKDNNIGSVLSLSVLMQRVKIVVDSPTGEKELMEYSIDELIEIRDKDGNHVGCPSKFKRASKSTDECPCKCEDVCQCKKDMD